MKETFHISKPKKVKIDDSKGMLFNLNKILKFIEKNTEVELTKGNVKKYASTLFWTKVEDISEENRIVYEKHFGEQPDLSTVKEKIGEGLKALSKDENVKYSIYTVREDLVTGKVEDNYYLAVNFNNSLTGAKNGNMFINRGSRYKYKVINVNTLITLGLVTESVKPVWERKKGKILKEIEEWYQSNGEERKFGRVEKDFDTRLKSTINVYLTDTKTFSSKHRGAYERSILPGKILRLIYNHLEFAYGQHLNYVQMVEYTKDRKSDYATAFMTKKNIHKSIQKEMKESPFLKYFKFVELDNDTDVSKYKKVYEEYEKSLKKVIKLPKTIELRFRKLGNRKAIGIYFPHKNCMAIDLRDISAFLHEYAHAIDFNKGGNNTLSLGEDFYPIIRHYKNNYHRLSKDNDYYTKKSMYYTSPTEIFARGFELAFKLKGYNSYLVAPQERMNDIPYLAFKGIEDELVEYFNKYIK